MLLDLSKADMINLVSTIVPDDITCVKLTNEGLMVWDGDRHIENWKWDKVKLDELDEYQLKAIYIKYAK